MSSSRHEDSTLSDNTAAKWVRDCPHGLVVVHNSAQTPKADIIFIHSSGLNSRVTWAKNGDSKLYWPQQFLPKDKLLNQTRILTYDYQFALTKSSDFSQIASQLLSHLKQAHDNSGRELGIGEVQRVLEPLTLRSADVYT